ncbi:hypothetical protein DY000_02033782 [Brassica cretica]|uniref:Uncharacterized protein n=1 Tax=Brassica cretica TaxID=69181 RepID=A0ABQ7DJK8_BRACR|nr:hypothetical protein DY000_02033782 [Brassica cretica]
MVTLRVGPKMMYHSEQQSSMCDATTMAMVVSEMAEEPLFQVKESTQESNYPRVEHEWPAVELFERELMWL